MNDPRSIEDTEWAPLATFARTLSAPGREVSAVYIGDPHAPGPIVVLIRDNATNIEKARYLPTGGMATQQMLEGRMENMVADLSRELDKEIDAHKLAMVQAKARLPKRGRR